MQSHPAQYDKGCFSLLFPPPPHREFQLLTTEQKPKEVIHGDCFSHGGNELTIIYENLKYKAGKHLVSLEICLRPQKSLCTW